MKQKIPEPRIHPGAKLTIAEDIKATVTSLRWDGETWTYVASYFHNGEYRSVELLSLELPEEAHG